ncbi:MAG: VanW family protein, partial [Clostridium sp.]
MEKNKSLKKSNNKNLFEKNKREILIGIVVVVVIIASVLAYTLVASNSVKEWESKVYPGVKVYGVDVGGLTKDEALAALNEKLSANIMDKTLIVTVGDKKLNLSYADLAPGYDAEAIV